VAPGALVRGTRGKERGHLISEWTGSATGMRPLLKSGLPIRLIIKVTEIRRVKVSDHFEIDLFDWCRRRHELLDSGFSLSPELRGKSLNVFCCVIEFNFS
jgi:hypothetical protein